MYKQSKETKMSYIVYKTTNLQNGKFYVGQHTLDDDEYLGSGIILHKAIKKYGKENFIRETLEEYETKEDMNEGEKFWIEKLDARNPKIAYNIGEGGTGGDNITHNPNREAIIEKQSRASKKMWEQPGRKEAHSKKMSGEGNLLYGVGHTEETKTKMSIIQKSMYNDPEFKERKLKELRDPVRTKKISEAKKIPLTDDEYDKLKSLFFEGRNSLG
jgi:group I intron endonuclease